jgi:hypothetical protein
LKSSTSLIDAGTMTQHPILKTMVTAEKILDNSFSFNGEHPDRSRTPQMKGSNKNKKEDEAAMTTLRKVSRFILSYSNLAQPGRREL